MSENSMSTAATRRPDGTHRVVSLVDLLIKIEMDLLWERVLGC